MAEYNLNCSLAIPYPEIKSVKLNRYDAQMLRTLLADKLCSINEYITQSVILSPDYPHLADMMDCIAVSESKHFKLIGRLLLLSGEPWDIAGLSGACRHMRRGRMRVDYTPVSIINANIERERLAVSDLKLVLSQIQEPVSNDLLERILLDKEHHIGILSELSLRYT